jgi:hypothetical protein
MARLVPAGVTLRDQVNTAHPKRDKRSDGWIGDAAHQARASDHNPDKDGWVHALDIDEDLVATKANAPARELADELVELARTGRDGGRIKYVVYEDQIASGTYKATFWTWRGSGYGHTEHVHVSFTDKAERDGSPFPLRCLGAQLWDGHVPDPALVRRAHDLGAASTGTWRVACRLGDLGLYVGTPQPKGVQRYPVKAVEAFQLARKIPATGNYTDRTHRALFG